MVNPKRTFAENITKLFRAEMLNNKELFGIDKYTLQDSFYGRARISTVIFTAALASSLTLDKNLEKRQPAAKDFVDFYDASVYAYWSRLYNKNPNLKPEYHFNIGFGFAKNFKHNLKTDTTSPEEIINTLKPGDERKFGGFVHEKFIEFAEKSNEIYGGNYGYPSAKAFIEFLHNMGLSKEADTFSMKGFAEDIKLAEGFRDLYPDLMIMGDGRGSGLFKKILNKEGVKTSALDF